MLLFQGGFLETVVKYSEFDVSNEKAGSPIILVMSFPVWQTLALIHVNIAAKHEFYVTYLLPKR